ncbi:gp15 [Rhodococcus phage ReqiPine5]|uniref:Gp15 n=1 Tax=Rhodococcus phage ReqiPine5 TaxID=691963 RepID=D4P7Z0_9CAUD|nr:gp15 [Rhodococcus phage ReqiPine5]ADD81120.1 gp15 [Rhodococcus phage ReqiPine5]
MAFPPYKYDPPLETPPVGGLLTVANVVTVPPPVRILGGVIVRDSVNMDIFPVISLDADLCAVVVDPEEPGPGLFPYTDRVFKPIMLTAPVECDPTITDDELTATATYVLDRKRSMFVEGYLFNVLLPQMKPTVSESIAVEQVLAVADFQTAMGGGTRVVHLNAYWATYLLGKGVIVKSGSIYRTALGNPISFGGGYMDGQGYNTAYITPAIAILQTAVQVDNVLDHQRNDRYTQASQILVPVVTSQDSAVDRFTITTSAAFPNGNAGGGSVTPGAYALLPSFTPGTDAVPGTSE